MEKIKTIELVGSQLNAAVAKALGLEYKVYFDGSVNVFNGEDFREFNPATNSKHCFKLIKQFRVNLCSRTIPRIKDWQCDISGQYMASDVDPLVAVCRCVVLSILGDEYDSRIYECK